MTPEDIERCFDGFTVSTFRLETLQQYTVDSEAPRIQAWHRGEPRPDRSVRTSPWLRRVAVTTAAGRHWSRVHVVDLPLSDYVRYQMVGYVEAAAAGEEIRIAVRSDHPELTDMHEDFWLFDEDTPNASAIAMRYDPVGRPLDRELVTNPSRIAAYKTVRAAAWEAAMPLNEFLANRARQERTCNA